MSRHLFYTVETESIILRLLRINDAENLTKTIYGNAEVMKYLPHSDMEPFERSQKSIERYIQYWHSHGYGPWAVVLKPQNQFIGRAGLKPLLLDRSTEIELIYAIEPAYWNRGLTTEVARASLCFGYTILEAKRIIAVTEPENAASQRVLAKVGMLAHGIQNLEAYGGQSLAFFDLPRAQWKQDCSTICQIKPENEAS